MSLPAGFISRVRIAAACIGAAVLAGCHDSARVIAPPAGAASVQALTVTSIEGVAAAVVNPSPSVIVRDQSGQPVANVLVRWEVVSGGGSISNSTIRTNTQGISSAGIWTLGAIAGMQELDATVVGVGTVRFVAQAAVSGAQRLVRLSTDPQTGVVGQPVPQPPSVRVEDANGNPVSGVVVTFSVTSGGGTITGAQKTTDASGVATADAWILGNIAGQQLARASISSGTSVAFSANAIADVAAAIAIVSGDHQQAQTGGALPLPLTVRVVDRFGNPVSGAEVLFTTGAGSGTVSPATTFTNSNGLASTSWTLGTAATQTVTVIVKSLNGISVTFTATAVATSFSITVRYVGFTPNARQQLAVDRAVAKFRSIIVGSSGTSQLSLPAQSCGRDWMPAVSTEVVTDLLLFVRFGVIDGTPANNNIIGNGNVCLIHPSSGLPAVGTLFLDIDDLALMESTGLIDPVVLHEMGHTLGIGTLWSRFLSPSPCVGGPGTDPFFTGPNANAQFLAIGGAAYSGNKVPVENEFPAMDTGSNCAHWREAVMGREIMTSRLNTGAFPLSVVTIGSMQDIGYSVSYANADPFSLASAIILGEASASTGVDLAGDVLPMPPLPPGAIIKDMSGRRR